MRILLDNNVHVGLAKDLIGHEVRHCKDLGWQKLLNGELVCAAAEQFDVLITVDKNMQHQTSLKGVDLGVVVLDAVNNRIDELRRFIPVLLRDIEEVKSGAYTVVTQSDLA